MAKILLNIFLVLVFFVNLSRPFVFAQTLTPAPTVSSPVFNPNPTTFIPLIPGIDCGDAESTKSNVQKCCLSKNLQWKDLIKLPDFGCVIDTPAIRGFCISRGVNGILDYIFSLDLVKWMNDFTKQQTEKVNPCINGNPSTTNYSDPNCTCVKQPASSKMLCDLYVASSKDYGDCVACSSKGVWTAIGCVNSDIGAFITEKLFTFGIGLAGVFALLCIIYSALQLQTSGGNPEKIKKAQEILTSCIMGLMLIIFSVFILKLIGVNILQIPGFTK